MKYDDEVETRIKEETENVKLWQDKVSRHKSISKVLNGDGGSAIMSLIDSEIESQTNSLLRDAANEQDIYEARGAIRALKAVKSSIQLTTSDSELKRLVQNQAFAQQKLEALNEAQRLESLNGQN